MTPLTFPSVKRPEVSVVIPLFGRWEWTARTLEAILANTEPCYELIVVDNASPDDSIERLVATTKNVCLVRNPKNYGVAIAYDEGAALARGRYLVFMNSDALVHPGWLPPLVETVSGNPLIGAAGPRFLYLDGTVQEAGALVLRDATTLAYGNRCPDTDRELRRLRVVDYVSNACFLIERRLFDLVGGYDPAYAPAYYSDVDISLRLAACGHLTVYEPRSVVTHVFGWAEKKTADDNAIARSRAFFTRRWSRLLESRPALRPEDGHIVASRDAPLLDRLLVVAERVPEEGSRGAALLRELSELYLTAHVALLATGSAPAAPEYLRRIEIAPIENELERVSGWLAKRRFHYDLVLSLSPRSTELERFIRATQPQASWILDFGLDEAKEIDRSGVAKRLVGADAVLVASEDARRTVAERMPSIPVFLVGDGEPGRPRLAEVLIHFGFAGSFARAIRAVSSG